ncbi:heavy-metal-associated domain-containing protein [Bacillus sp. T3]|uniref:heavy-metal-associated domain-containing protein n=1 Tax=Bacillus sp. T3 TaxID=467262 RepID=UPI002980C612|nr:cation transporter [Bacillus sp. T3]
MNKKILIEGMSCDHCIKHVTNALTELNGVTNVDVNLKENFAILNANTEVKDEDIKFALDDAGYDVVGIEVL